MNTTLCIHWNDRPYAPLGLYTVIRVHGHKILDVLSTLQTLSGYLSATKQTGHQVSLAPECLASVIEDLKKLQPILTELDFPIARRMSIRLVALLNSGNHRHYDLFTHLQNFCMTVQDEIENIVLLAVPSDKRAYFLAEKGVPSEDLLGKFPSVPLRLKRPASATPRGGILLQFFLR